MLFVVSLVAFLITVLFFFQAEDGIRDLVRSRGLGDVYKRQDLRNSTAALLAATGDAPSAGRDRFLSLSDIRYDPCLLYTSDAADERSSVDLGGRRIIKKKNSRNRTRMTIHQRNTKSDVILYTLRIIMIHK